MNTMNDSAIAVIRMIRRYGFALKSESSPTGLPHWGRRGEYLIVPGDSPQEQVTIVKPNGASTFVEGVGPTADRLARELAYLPEGLPLAEVVSALWPVLRDERS